MPKQQLQAWTLRAVLLGVLTFLPASLTPAQAWVFHDGAAFGQRILHLAKMLAQYNQIIRSSGDQLLAFKAAYAGLRDWRNFGWVDVLRVVDCPWFDQVKGIDDIRRAVDVTVMDTEQAQMAWDHAHFYAEMLSNPRYTNDPWFRAKVNSLLRQSSRAKNVKTALLDQLRLENKQLIEDVKKIRRVKEEIQKVNNSQPVDVTKLASLQAELQATEAKFEGNGLILKNQQAIMFLVGENDAQKAFEETIERGWIKGNTRALKQLGANFARRR